VIKDMKTILLQKVLFNPIKRARKLSYVNLTKQLNPLLLLLFIFTTLISTPAFTKQEMPFKQTANLYSIAEDNKGFIWLSGQNGLYRYDGKESINFSNKEQGWTIPFNWINGMSMHDNHLILATEKNGLWTFNTETTKSTPINISTETKTFYRAIHHKGSYYAISMAPQHLYRYDIATKKTTLIAKNISNDALISSENRVYFNDNEKLLYLDSVKNNNKIQQVNKVSKRVTATASIKNTTVIASENYLFSINDNGNITKEPISSLITAITPHNNQKDILLVDTSGNITKRELSTLKLLDNSFPRVKKSRYQVLHHDKSGVLWLGNSRSFQQLIQNLVKSIPLVFDTQFSYIQTEVYQHKIYIGSNGQGVFSYSPLSKHKTTPIQSINTQLSNKAKTINDLLTIGQNLFIASFDGLWRHNEKNKQTHKVNLSFNKADLSNLALLRLRQKDGLLYIATDGQGLVVYDVNNGTVIQHLNKGKGLSSGEVIDILPLDSGDIWLATASGIDIIRNNTEKVYTITSQTSAKFISLLQVDGKVFATTKGDGIWVYTLQGQLLSHFAKGINFNYMSLIDGNILASAKPGLYKVNPATYQFTMISNTGDFTFTDNTFTFNNALYIANSLGILKLPKTTSPPFHPRVYISKTTVSGRAYLLNKAINIASDNDVITLALASLDYRPGVTKQYRYTLNGNTWHQISGNQLTLTGLASGSYHIEIMATNSLGQWSNYKAYTEINVAFPWYWTPQIRLFYAIAFFFIVLFSIWLFYLHSKSIRHIHTILQNDISNYGKTSMQVKRNLTVALAFLDENKINKSKMLLQQCLDELNEQQQSPEPNSLNGNSLTIAIPFLAEYLQKKYQTTLSFQFDVNESELEYELQADLYRVVFEAITSAIIKGSGRSFKVVIQKFKTKIWLNISDDNQSFINFNSKVNIDISMYYIQQIASKYKGSINTFNEQGNGSQLILSLPIKRNNY